ncbi:MAG: SDR family oxidoreductase [Nitrospinaceae bacterium]|jgi:NAD(P)-dependent dehydrogenase (short-subunit alcohol dehydrogenase family)|nr:SDR family oxidoreductase [Nitrospinaceae bacterium]MBT4430724.1 SDR family oxidoreductase [Nitrospinaceae bacterium]MBT5367312.1 SDR family oxidoreductase [Nitrospinaceae bacterium]MBT6394910.1 SDR family oxidoreductase [Nitrospinaceae bacterium]
MKELFGLNGQVAVITGGAGLLGVKHSEAIAMAGGIPVLLDIDAGRAVAAAKKISDQYRSDAVGLGCDITRANMVEEVRDKILERFGRIDILINNAANNPKVEDGPEGENWSRLENFPLAQWNEDVAVGLTGAFLCSRTFGAEMARRGSGVIINIASDLAIISPDQRLYRKEGVAEERQPVKPVTYSVVKTGLLGLTRYLATYWVEKGVRVNSISPGGIYTNQPEDFVEKLSALIPMGRMADVDEYQGAILFLCSKASSYMTGHNLIMDGGRTTW